MRSFALFLGFVLSGLPTAVAFERDGAFDACKGCPGEPESNEDACSPLCPDCVCSLGARTAVPAVLLLSAPALSACGDVEPPSKNPGNPPREPALDDVFHPPKHA